MGNLKKMGICDRKWVYDKENGSKGERKWVA